MYAVAAYLLAGEEMGVREFIGAALIISASLLSGKIHAEPRILVAPLDVK